MGRGGHFRHRIIARRGAGAGGHADRFVSIHNQRAWKLPAHDEFSLPGRRRNQDNGSDAAGRGSSGGVTLKLNGFRITAGSAASGVAIHVGAPSAMTDHVVISGPGLITNDPLNAFKFQTGIEMDNADFSQISQVTVVGSANTGIRGSGCTFLTVASNIVGRTSGPNPGDGIGLALSLSGSSTITGNDTSGNAVGIDLDSQHSIGDPNPTTLSNNIANGNSQDGIHLTNFHPSGVRISGNVTNGNGNSGIHVGGGASPTLVFSNTSAAANGTSDLADDNFPVVVGGPGCLGDVWSGNVFFTRNQPCIN